VPDRWIHLEKSYFR